MLFSEPWKRQQPPGLCPQSHDVTLEILIILDKETGPGSSHFLALGGVACVQGVLVSDNLRSSDYYQVLIS